jgi:hypothetical protein
MFNRKFSRANAWIFPIAMWGCLLAYVVLALLANVGV